MLWMAVLHLTPTECAIAAFGSAAEVARVAKVERSTVHYWNKPSADDGCGGEIPGTRHIRTIAPDLMRAL